MSQKYWFASIFNSLQHLKFVFSFKCTNYSM